MKVRSVEGRQGTEPAVRRDVLRRHDVGHVAVIQVGGYEPSGRGFVVVHGQIGQSGAARQPHDDHLKLLTAIRPVAEIGGRSGFVHVGNHVRPVF